MTTPELPNPNICKRFEAALGAQWPLDRWEGTTVIVGVSGGADSVALLRGLDVLARASPLATTLCVAHMNHRWRGEASDEDEQFVQDLARELGRDCLVERGPSRAMKQEEEARRQRYAFFRRIAEERGARFVALAHQRDDQIETILHRIIRGTGLAGLAGILPFRVLTPAVTLIRPMLPISRREVLEYLEQLRQPYRHDVTNLDLSWTRNRIRQDLLPRLQHDYNPQVSEALWRLGRLASEAQEALLQVAKTQFDQAVRHESPGCCRLTAPVLLPLPPYLQREVLALVWRRQGWREQEMDYVRWNRIVSAIGNEEQFDLPGPVSVLSDRHTLEFRGRAMER